MTDHATPPVVLPPVLDPDYGIVMHAYVQLPLFRRRENGFWVAPLKKLNACELRLVEYVPAAAGEPVLRVELFDRRTQSIVETRPCEELEDAVAAFKALVPVAEAYPAIPHQAEGPDGSWDPQGCQEHDRYQRPSTGEGK